MDQEVQKQEQRAPATAGGGMSRKLFGRMANKFGVDAVKLADILRDTVFVPSKKDPRPFNDAEVAAALILAERYDLDPFAKEIYMTRSKGKLLVIVSIDGWLKIINQHEAYDGQEVSFEFKKDGTTPQSCTCRMWRKDRTHPTVITEYYDECYQDTQPWNKWPVRMLRHKAIIQTARVCFSLGGIVDEDEAQRFETPEYTVRDEPAPQRQAIAEPPPRKPPREVRPEAPPAAQEHEDDPEERERRKLYAQWQKVAPRLSTEQLRDCREAAGVDLISADASVDQLHAVLARADEILEASES